MCTNVSNLEIRKGIFLFDSFYKGRELYFCEDNDTYLFYNGRRENSTFHVTLKHMDKSWVMISKIDCGYHIVVDEWLGNILDAAIDMMPSQNNNILLFPSVAMK